MLSMNTKEFKKKLEACVDYEDLFSLMRITPKDILKDFVNALNKATEYIELTMRDECFLNTAKGYIDFKG
jgi:hypothetical protein